MREAFPALINVTHAGTRPLASTVAAVSGNSGPAQRNNVWQRYEQKIAVHRQQLDSTKLQLDAALRKLNDMQVRATAAHPTLPCALGTV